MKRKTTTHIVFHHAAFEGDVSAQEVDRWHKQRGFREIGYHYVIRKDGAIEKGRNIDRTGAHCRAGGMNRISVGICITGHGNKEHWSEAQKKSFVYLFKELNSKYKIPAWNVIGHREVGANTDCPGTIIDCDKVRAMLLYEPNKNQNGT